MMMILPPLSLSLLVRMKVKMKMKMKMQIELECIYDNTIELKYLEKKERKKEIK